MRILLYAPTFRKNMIKDGNDIDLSVYNIDYKRVQDCLEKKFGGRWIPMIRLHPNISKHAHLLNLPKEILDASNYPDVQDLLICSDCLLTDYSSIIFDFGIMNKPAFIYAPDYDEYKNDRGIYFDLEKLPFLASRSEAELEKSIKDYNKDNYLKELNEFYYKQCGLKQGGNAAKSVCDRIEEVIDDVKV